MTVGDLDRKMSRKEYMLWKHYAQIEPFGDRTQHIMMAQFCALLFNVNRNPKKGKPAKHHDFDLFEDAWTREKRKEIEGQSFRKMFTASVEAFNARFEKKED